MCRTTQVRRSSDRPAHLYRHAFPSLTLVRSAYSHRFNQLTAGVFDELTSQLAKITPFICRLTAIDCGSLPAIIQKLFTEFVSALDLEDEPKFKRALVNVENLVQLYKLVTQEDPPVSGSPRKRKSSM